MLWKKTYPTIATVNQANKDTLLAWGEHLPPPQTDVERTVHRRVNRKCLAIAEESLRVADPKLADKFDELMNLTSSLLGTDAREL